jgi:hypothetical protein
MWRVTLVNRASPINIKLGDLCVFAVQIRVLSAELLIKEVSRIQTNVVTGKTGDIRREPSAVAGASDASARSGYSHKEALER